MTTGDDQLEAMWRKWCEEVAAAEGKTYEEVIADLEAGRAALEISFTIPPSKDRQH